MQEYSLPAPNSGSLRRGSGRTASSRWITHLLCGPVVVRQQPLHGAACSCCPTEQNDWGAYLKRHQFQHVNAGFETAAARAERFVWSASVCSAAHFTPPPSPGMDSSCGGLAYRVCSDPGPCASPDLETHSPARLGSSSVRGYGCGRGLRCHISLPCWLQGSRLLSSPELTINNKRCYGDHGLVCLCVGLLCRRAETVATV
jgi:hypothetical protein